MRVVAPGTEAAFLREIDERPVHAQGRRLVRQADPCRPWRARVALAAVAQFFPPGWPGNHAPGIGCGAYAEQHSQLHILPAFCLSVHTPAPRALREPVVHREHILGHGIGCLQGIVLQAGYGCYS